MSSTTPLVLQLQEDVLDKGVSLADLLRKAKVVATKLDLAEFGSWVDRELNGYGTGETIPEYRKVKGAPKFNDSYHGWQPIQFGDSHDIHDFFSTRYIGQPIGSLEDVVRRKSDGTLIVPYTSKVEHQLQKAIGETLPVALHMDSSSAVAILDAARNNVLEWSLRLEKAGILGEGLRFSQNERQQARTITYNINNVGVLGDVSGSAVVSPQQMASETTIDLRDLRRVLDEIELHVKTSRPGVESQVKNCLDQMKQELENSEPDQSQIQVTLDSLKTICEGTAGNLLASGILGLIRPFIG
jgi:hypothetical protein